MEQKIIINQDEHDRRCDDTEHKLQSSVGVSEKNIVFKMN